MSLRSARRGPGRVLLVLAAAAALSGVGATNASAYTHNWFCDNVQMTSAVRCWDWTGQQYNSWVEVRNAMWNGQTHPEVCAKGRTAAGNTRDGGSNGCAYWANFRRSCFGWPDPQTQAYIYFIRNDPYGYSTDGRAATPADTVC